MNKKIKFIDLFAGLGGIRIGFEKGFNKNGFQTECVLTSEIKPHAINALNENFEHENFVGDIFDVDSNLIPDFDFLLAGFPCQPFSSGGKRQGFLDTRGTLFFEIERILRDKKPFGFILENVEGLVRHDLRKKDDKIGQTLSTILKKLSNELDYKVEWKVIDSSEYGLPQSRKRIFIVGTKFVKPTLEYERQDLVKLSKVLEKGLKNIDSKFTKLLLKNFDVEDLYGKSIKDKRGGENNIHSWDIKLKGPVNKDQIILLNKLFKERRKKHWAKEIGIPWMDGMPLTLNQISTFYKHKNLKGLLDDLVDKKYLKKEFPKKIVELFSENGVKKYREYDKSKPKGYNIVTGKLSFEINKILDPNGIAPTLVATDVSKLAVPDGSGLRRLTVREGLRCFGFPESYKLNQEKAFDLLGNTVPIPIIKLISDELCLIYSDSLIPV